MGDSERGGFNISLPPYLADRLRAAIYKLQADPAMKFKHQATDRIIQLGIPLIRDGAMPDIYGGRGRVGRVSRTTVYSFAESVKALEDLFEEMSARGLPWSEYTGLTFRALVVCAGCDSVMGSGGSDAGGVTSQKRRGKK